MVVRGRMSAVYSALVLLIGIGFNTATSADVDYLIYKEKYKEYIVWAQGVMPESVMPVDSDARRVGSS